MAKYAVAVAPPEKPGQSALFRSYQAPDKAISSPFGLEDVTTVHELVLHGTETYRSEPCLGQRKFIKLHTETREVTKIIDGEERKVNKDWQYYELGPYNWLSFKEAEEARKALGAGLVKAGMQPGKSKFHIYAKTCREWMLTGIACAGQNLTIVTAYDTLGVQGLRESINQTGTQGILLDKDNIPNLAKVLKDAPSLKLVIYRDFEGELSQKERDSIKEFEQVNGGIKVMKFSEVIELGRENPIDYNPPTPEDICCIMYTSGSTGPPKGVTLLHSTVIAGVSGATGNINTKIVRPGDFFLSILPLAHILEYTAELATFVWGAALGYGHPKTISDTNMRNCKGDMRELRPTILVAVPAVFEAIKKGVIGKVNKASSVAQRVFWGAFRLKQKLTAWQLPVSLVDVVVFKAIKEATGGRLRYTMCGGAPVSDFTREFVNTLVAPLIMGYGLTETNAMLSLMNPQQLDMDTAGEIVPSITIKLVDVAESGYYVRNNQGEIWVTGPAVSPGYWKNEKETKEAYTEDGWFKTGDIAEITPQGKIKVVDRKKNLIKTLNGEYVAVERLESLYRSNAYVSNICVMANSEHAKPIAVVVVLEPALKELASKIGVEYSENIVHEKKVYNALLKSLHETAQECDLKPVEWLAAVYLTDEEWTTDNGFVTSAQKIQRKKIAQEYKKGVDEAFEKA